MARPTDGPAIKAFGRRRALALIAAAAGLPLLGSERAVAKPLVWHGVALGARSTITLCHADEAVARRLLKEVLAEVRRLEGIFSLYRADSAISRLNRLGRLEAPPPEMVELLARARTVSALTGGAFDATVQPLWRLYADHFARPAADPGGPAEDERQRALARVDYRALSIGSDAIAFDRPGMAVTLNGIAQGYITDRVAALLRRAGLDHVLIDLGEIRALGRHPDARPWRAGIAEPGGFGELLHEVTLEDRALATSAGAGTRFDPAGRHHHLFDPRSGRSTRHHASVSVLAPSATLADGLSTGFSSMSGEAIATVCRELLEVRAMVFERAQSPARSRGPA